MNFERLNKITAWLVFALSLLVYILTMEKSASFWDSGEFIAAANKLQIVHPPGAPLYLILGRIFSMFLPQSMVALGVNFLSVLATAFASLFIYLNTSILAKRLLHSKDAVFTKGQQYAVIGSGIVAAFAFVFQDSQWFNAVEAEVYALSTCLTALVFWMALKWSEQPNNNESNRWLVAIALVVGLSIGVHLLNLLVIPAIALLIYFYRGTEQTVKGGLIAFAAGLLILLFVQYGVILELPQLGSGFELLFVNSLGLPFSSGLIALLVIIFLIPILLIVYLEKGNKTLLYISLALMALIAISEFFNINTIGGSVFKALIIAAIAYGIWHFRERKSLIYKASLSFLFILIGYLSFIFIPIRSLANPPIDINNPDNVFSLLSYLNREQYGDRPLLFGPMYNAEPVGTKTLGNIYVKGDDKYEIIDQKFDYEFAPEDQMLFPRAWQFLSDTKVNYYKSWLNKGNESPNMFDNLKFFFTYQLDFMYWRYFMWNFAGRQNTVQADGLGDNGNWMSGISLADNGRVVSALTKPDTVAHNASVNHFYLLPFAFGMIGLVLHFAFARKDAFVVTALFILTGVAIVVYLNQEPLQPRERDYAYVGSFMAFAIWIGLAVAGLYKMAEKFVWNDIIKVGLWVIGAFAAIFFMGFGMNNPSTLFGILLCLLIVFGVVYAIAMLLQKANGGVKAIVLTVLIGIAPALMGFVGWNDHDRHHLKLASDVGKNYLNTAAENAILFTEGDNDTYPLWYAQEVENVRPDIRIVNNSLLKSDWYADQVTQHNGHQPGLVFSYTSDEYAAGVRDHIYYLGQDLFPSMSFSQLAEFIKSDDSRTKYQTPNGTVDILPTKTFTVDVNINEQVNNGLLTPEQAAEVDSTLVIHLSEGKQVLSHDEYLIFDLIQRYYNSRPIYFTSENLPAQLGLSKYLRREGSAFRLYPKLHPNYGKEMYSDYNPYVDLDKTYDFMMNDMLYGNVKSGVYLEETGQRQLLRMFDYASNMVYDFAARDLPGDKEKALNLYNLLQENFYNTSVPQDEMYVVLRNVNVIDALFMIGQKEEAITLAKRTANSALTQLEYIQSSNMQLSNEQSILQTMPSVIEALRQMADDKGSTELANWLDNRISEYE